MLYLYCVNEDVSSNYKQKTMKNLKVILLILSIISFNSCSTQKQIPFTWKSFDSNGKQYERGFMFVPISFPEIHKKFQMQFDLGANVSLIYENSLDTIIAKHPNFQTKIVKLNDKFRMVKTNFKLGNYVPDNDSLFIYPKYGDKTNFDNLSKIGSIGANLISSKILIIDFPNKTLKIRKSMSENEKDKFVCTDLENKNGKLVIKLKINNKLYNFLYDSGASAFPIITTDKNFYDLLTGAEKIDKEKITGNSWGNKINIFGAESSYDIYLENISLNKNKKYKTYYTDSKRNADNLNKIGVIGTIGNELFINDIIVIDLKNKKFGIRKK